MKPTLILLALLCAVATWAADPMGLLTDNMPANGSTPLFPKGTPVIGTGATYEFVTSGEFATDKETLKSTKDIGIKALFDGGNWWKSQSFGEWGGGKWVTITIDLQADYLIGKVDLWALRDTQRDTEKADILFSDDGKEFTKHGTAQNTTDEPVDEVHKKKNFILHTKTLDQPVRARYVQLRILKRRHQQQLADIAIWGWGIGEGASIRYLKADDKPTVGFTIRAIQDGAAFANWEGAAASLDDVTGWQVYAADAPFTRIDAEGVRLAHSFDKRQTSAALYPYTPGATVYFGMAAAYGEKVYPVVEAQALTFPTPYQRDTFGDMLAVNHFPGGGATIRSKAWLDFSMELLEQSPFTGSRWWYMYPNEVKMFLSRGMGMVSWPMDGSSGQDNIKNANALGLFSFTKGNEPELKGTSPAKYLEGLKKEHASAKSRSPWNTIAAPTCNLNPSALEWLEGFYAVDSKDYFDVLDLHTYSDTPEDLFEKMDLVRAIMAKHGDEAKPIISTEYGFADRPAGKFRISPLQKAQYLARGLVIHYVLGFKRVYVYSFADIGTDPYNNEHHFGLLDYDLQKKPGYHAVATLGQQLGDTVLDGPLPGVDAPALGYQFTTPEQAAYVAVVWCATGERLGTFATAADEVQVTDLLGNTRRVILDASGTLSLPYGASPIYIRSTSPIRQTASREIAGTAAAGGEEVSMVFDAATENLIVDAGATRAVLPVTLRNGYAESVPCTILVKDSAGTTMAQQTLPVPAGETLQHGLAFDLAMPADTAMKRYSVLLSYQTPLSTYSEERALAVRRLEKAGPGVTCVARSFEGVDHPIYLLSNAALEVAFDPQQGGRMLDLIDRASRSNQIHMDYDKVADLTSFPYAYAMWFHFNKQLKNSPWQATAKDGALALSATDTKNGTAITLTWTMDPTAAKLRLEVTTTNNSGKPLKAVAYVHPEYNVSGYGESQTDQLFFPTADGEFCLPFWADLGERSVPALTEKRWHATDTLTGLTLRQTFSDGWGTPKIWFGHGTYNVEMTHQADLAPDEVGSAWIDWQLVTTPTQPAPNGDNQQ